MVPRKTAFHTNCIIASIACIVGSKAIHHSCCKQAQNAGRKPSKNKDGYAEH